MSLWLDVLDPCSSGGLSDPVIVDEEGASLPGDVFQSGELLAMEDLAVSPPHLGADVPGDEAAFGGLALGQLYCTVKSPVSLHGLLL